MKISTYYVLPIRLDKDGYCTKAQPDEEHLWSLYHTKKDGTSEWLADFLKEGMALIMQLVLAATEENV